MAKKWHCEKCNKGGVVESPEEIGDAHKLASPECNQKTETLIDTCT